MFPSLLPWPSHRLPAAGSRTWKEVLQELPWKSCWSGTWHYQEAKINSFERRMILDPIISWMLSSRTCKAEELGAKAVWTPFMPYSLPKTHSLGFGQDSALVKDLWIARDRNPTQNGLHTKEKESLGSHDYKTQGICFQRWLNSELRQCPEDSVLHSPPLCSVLLCGLPSGRFSPPRSKMVISFSATPVERLFLQ